MSERRPPDAPFPTASAEGPLEARSIAVHAAVPLFRRGLTLTLQGIGFAVHEPHDLFAWFAGARNDLAVMDLRAGADWRLLRRVTDGQPDSLVIAILPDSRPQTFGRALMAGASTAVPHDVDEAQICDVVSAAARGNAVLPAKIVHLMADSNARDGNGRDLTETEAAWLSALAHGSTVVQLARDARYSEREMYRLLQRLYRRLGARTRGQALVAAAHQGLIS
jgi:DNA-binding NarL/FixJ family response regulator